MSHFYATAEGQRGTVTKAGSKTSGLVTHAASFNGAIKVSLYVDAQGRDCFKVEQTKWQGVGVERVVAEGVLGEAP